MDGDRIAAISAAVFYPAVHRLPRCYRAVPSAGCGCWTDIPCTVPFALPAPPGQTGGFLLLANAFMRIIIAIVSIIFLLLCYNKLIILLYYYERFLATFIDYTSDLCYYEGDIIKLFLSESYIYCQSLGLGQCKLSMR